MKKWIDLAFEIGQEVYLKTDDDQKKRIVCEVNLKQTGVIYRLCCGIADSWHYDFEITVDINVKAKTTD